MAEQAKNGLAVKTVQKDAGYADVIEDETGDGYCASCVDVMAGYGHEEFIFMQKQLKEDPQ